MSGYKQKYYHYSNGIYGLADTHYRNLWLVMSNETHAHQIRKVFTAKISLVVFDLTKFTNFIQEENTVDTDVCFSWQVPPTSDDHAITVSLIVDTLSQTQTAYSESTELINEPISTLLPIEKQLELQDQIFLYKKILEITDQWLTVAENNQHHLKFSYGIADKSAQEQFFEFIDDIFLIELSLADIEAKLHQLCLKYLGNVHGPTALLKLLGKSLYE